MLEQLKRALTEGQRIAVLMGGASPERAVSLRSGAALMGALEKRGWNPVSIDPANGRELPEALLKNRVAAAVLALHGEGGEDGAIQGLLETLGIPYTGSFVGPSALCMNKIASKRLFRDAGLPTPAWEEVVVDGEESLASLPDLALNPPCFVKPMATGSSVGISRVDDREGLKEALRIAVRASGSGKTRILVEEEIIGPELTLAILDDRPLPLIEIRPAAGFFDYNAKYASGETRYLIPPESVDPATLERATRIGLEAGRVAGCRGLYRVDLMVDGDGTPWVLEINTLPGMTATSLAPKAAAAIGISFEDLAERILAGAGLERCRASS
ncbi:D-alanine--D-alanine ligase B [Candidatus Magnetaquicoccaceae bacterium FCR-1]|uniref:D-alanine--D-alanine ligase n=1 Tax=Candidatus Magnetaquiglobus chichijimensis TaxID=3141448 RepID=A0ABQ0CBM0_9PROT